jgi:hypothetical protein
MAQGIPAPGCEIRSFRDGAPPEVGGGGFAELIQRKSQRVEMCSNRAMPVRFNTRSDRGRHAIAARLHGLVRGGLQALLLVFAIAQTVSPLLHAHFSDEIEGSSGVHIHFGVSSPAPWLEAFATSEMRDFDARILSAPAAHVRDEPIRLFDLPAVVGPQYLASKAASGGAVARFVPVPTTAAQPFPKPLPLAPPASA